MLKHSLWLVVIFTLLFFGENTRPITLQIGNEHPESSMLPMPSVNREQNAAAAGEKTAIQPIDESDQQKNMPIAGGHYPQETTPIISNQDDRNSENQLPQSGTPYLKKTMDDPLLPETGINFLLLGYRHSKTEVLMVVSLIPGEAAALLAIHPDTINRAKDNRLVQIAATPMDPADRKALNKCLEEISGKKIQFMIELNLEGVAEMVDIMGGVKYSPDAGLPYELFIEGAQAIDLLVRESIPAREKQRLLQAILLKAGALELTKVGWALLKIGYHSLNTDLSVTDLLELRKVTHSISPYQMNYQELP